MFPEPFQPFNLPAFQPLESPSMKSTAVLALVFLAACVAPAQPQPQTQPKLPAQTQAATPPAEAAAPAPPANTIEAKTAKLQLIDGFLPLYWDAEGGKLLMRITHVG